jgi:hypothetical protein
MISRHIWGRTITLTDSASTTPIIDFRQAAGGAIVVIGAPTTLTFHAACDPEGTFGPLHDAANAPITRTVTQGDAIDFPPECYAFGAVRIVGASSAAIEYSIKG